MSKVAEKTGKSVVLRRSKPPAPGSHVFTVRKLVKKNERQESGEDSRMADPVFATLARPVLPSLEKRNRARLQMQSPQRLYFYWSVEANPYQTMRKAFGRAAENYTLAVRLVNLSKGWEETHPVDAEGNWWFNVEPNCWYRTEIGFVAPNRPYVRILFSNIAETPRRNPSPRPASESEWAISADKFAEVLDGSGFTGDALEVALAGDDADLARERTRLALMQLLGIDIDFSAFDDEEVRFAILMLAGGASIEELRGQISEALYLLLSGHLAALSAERSLGALQSNFDIIEDDESETEETGPAVFGASLVHFPKRRRKLGRRLVPHEFPKVGQGPSPMSSGKR